MSRSRSPKCHRGRGCGACGAPECDPITAREAIEEGLTYYPEDPEDPTDVPVRPMDAARERVVSRAKFSGTDHKRDIVDRLEEVWHRGGWDPTFANARINPDSPSAAVERARLHASARAAMVAGLEPWEWLLAQGYDREAGGGVTNREINAIIALVWGLQ